ncbi:MAG: putative transporter [Bacteroidales bacterium]|nr:putative transporter [Bacteroidales bacterium]
MTWLNNLFFNDSVAHTILVFSMVIATGVLLGKIKIFGISLGVAFVLFTGILAGHLGFTVNHPTAEFIKEFGLVLFVFFIGLQLGPGFFSSLKKDGLKLNLLAVGIVFLGALTSMTIHFITGVSMPVLTGIMSGAVTNTPGLGAAQQALTQACGPDSPDLGLGYAVAYPFGVLGVILTMIFIRKISKTDLKKEQHEYEQKQNPQEAKPEKISIEITNPLFFGKKIKEISHHLHNDAVISRILHNGKESIANSETKCESGDIVLLVAQKGDIPELVKLLGKPSTLDLATYMGKLVSKQVFVTNRPVIGKNLSSLKLRSRFDINITRITRAGIELVAHPDIVLQFGDKLTVVGDEKHIENVAHLLGNSLKRLDEPGLFPIFTGILFGIILGSLPLAIPGIPTPVKLGMAGGPLIVAILLSRYGYKLSLNSYTTPSANKMLRETGIVMFLAGVGLKSGESFVSTLLQGDGLLWIGYGAIITAVPIIIIGFITKFILKRNFFELCGLLAGSMTDPPALAFANTMAQSDAPAVAYAAVYPLVMFLRIIIAQLLVLFFI